MKKKLLSFVLVISSILVLFPSASMTAFAAEPITDKIIQERINELNHLLGGKYFTTDQNSASSNSDRSKPSNIIKQDWFQKMFGNVKSSQLYLSNSKSCVGFVGFAAWYIFRNSANDTVLKAKEISGKTFNYSDISENAQIGDYIYVHNTDKYGNGHAFIFISADSNGVKVLDSNGGGSNCKVQIRTIPFNSANFANHKMGIVKFKSKEAGSPVRGTSPITPPPQSPASPQNGHWEYRYVGYTTSNGRHECWCETYLKNKFESANLRYSNWSTTQYSPNGSSWTCGSNCRGSHTGISKTGSNGAPYWSEYTLPDGKNYYWEEKRWVEDTPITPPSVCTQHTKGNTLYCEGIHPHRNYYTCSVCGKEFTDGVTNYVDSCEICNPGPVTPSGHWEQVGWTVNAPSPSDTIRNKEERSIEVSSSRTEYRYVGYATTDGKHECWCETYLRSKFGSSVLRYSDWSTTRYSANGSGWTCGQCNGNHTGVDHYGNNGSAWWAEFTLPDGKNFYWEESRTVPAQYRTEYRYEKWVPN